jgi:hypothetical protein
MCIPAQVPFTMGRKNSMLSHRRDLFQNPLCFGQALEKPIKNPVFPLNIKGFSLKKGKSGRIFQKPVGFGEGRGLFIIKVNMAVY